MRVAAAAGRAMLVAAALAATAALGACDQPRWDDPAYVATALQEGDTARQRLAWDKYQALEDEQRKEVAPALVAVYLANGPLAKDAMQELVTMRVPEAKEAYLKEVETNQARFAGAAAEALGEAGARDAIGPMLTALEKTDDPDLKAGILRGLGYMPDEQMVEPLVKILQLDADNNPIKLHAFACEALGELAQQKPQAFDEGAARALVRAAWLSNNTRQNVFRECGLAIQQLGEPAVPVLLGIYAGENAEVQKLMMSYGFPQNQPKLMAAQRLNSLRAAGAADTLVADLMGTKAAPSDINKTPAAVDWRVQANRNIQETQYALAGIASVHKGKREAARGALEAVLTGERNEGWDDITDGLMELQYRMDAAQALNRLGDRAALPALLQMIDKGVVIDYERRAAMLAQQGQPVSEAERYRFNVSAAEAYANLATGDKLGDYNAVVAATKSDDLKKEYQKLAPAIRLAKTCEAKGEAAAQAACYAASLDDGDDLLRIKAAWEVGRLPMEVAAPLLIEHLGTENLEVREILTFHLYKEGIPAKEALAAVDRILEASANESEPAHKLDRFRLQLLRAYLQNRAA